MSLYISNTVLLSVLTMLLMMFCVCHGGMCCGGMSAAPARRPSANKKLNVAHAFGCM